MEEVSPAAIAMVRGILNCGNHHEENATRPAVEFALGCDRCAAQVFEVIYNIGVNTMAKEAVRVVQVHIK